MLPRTVAALMSIGFETVRPCMPTAALAEPEALALELEDELDAELELELELDPELELELDELQGTQQP